MEGVAHNKYNTLGGPTVKNKLSPSVASGFDKNNPSTEIENIYVKVICSSALCLKKMYVCDE